MRTPSPYDTGTLKGMRSIAKRGSKLNLPTKKHMFWAGYAPNPITSTYVPNMLRVGDRWQWRNGSTLFEVVCVTDTTEGVEIFSQIVGEDEGGDHITREKWDTMVHNGRFWGLVE